MYRNKVHFWITSRESCVQTKGVYLSKEEAKDEYKHKPTDVKFVIPATVPPLNEATKRLVERANAEAKK